MTVEQAISQIASLPLEHQLRVVQTIWDRMPQDAGTSLTEPQRAELERRVARYRANPELTRCRPELAGQK